MLKRNFCVATQILRHLHFDQLKRKTAQMVTLWSSFFRSTLFEQILTVIRIISRTGSTGRHTIPTQTSNNNKEISRHTHYQNKRTHRDLGGRLSYLFADCVWLRLLEFSQFNEPLRLERERTKHRRSHNARFKRSSCSQFVSRFNKIFYVLVHIFFAKRNRITTKWKYFAQKYMLIAHFSFQVCKNPRSWDYRRAQSTGMNGRETFNNRVHTKRISISSVYYICPQRLYGKVQSDTISLKIDCLNNSNKSKVRT